MNRQPEYVAWLEGQDRETKEALLYGNWYVTKQFDSYFKRKYCKIVDYAPMTGRRFRGFDHAGSLVDEVNRDPDYTATVLMSKTGDRYCIEHVHRFRKQYHEVEQYILELSRTDDDDVVYVLPVDSGSAGKAYARSLQQKLAEQTGRYCILHQTGNKSKLIRFRPFASVAQAGAVEVVYAPWNDYFFDELEMFQGDGKTHDDMLDAAVSAFWGLNKGIVIPDFQLPDMTTSNPFNGFQ